jgi:carboxylate-amine ligase
MANDYSFGIEEEYFLVDAATRSAARQMPEVFLNAAKEATGGRVAGEFLQSQIEVVSRPHTDMQTARAELRELRRTLAEIAAAHDFAIFASGTHPTAVWRRSRQREGERYDTVMDDLQMIGQLNMLCGLHVHVELPDPSRRVEIMMRMLPYLPLFVALATSSPFWQGRRTGLKGYRLAAYDELPRTGIPELFRSREEFDAYVDALVRAGVMPDSSYIWWAIRPSLKHPTLELRAPDCCTRLEDSLAIAALYRALARRLVRAPWLHWDLNTVSRAIIVENKWRAQRYGVAGTFVNIDGSGATTVADLIEQVLNEVTPDAEALECRKEVERCRRMVQEGTSADMQLKIFDAQENSDSPERSLKPVVDWIAETTMQ